MADFWAGVTVVVVSNVLPLGGPARTRQVRRSAAAAAGYNGDIYSQVPSQESPPMTTPSEPIEIYCVKCKAKTASRDIEAVTMKNGRPATRSVCMDCGTKKFRIGVLP